MQNSGEDRWFEISPQCRIRSSGGRGQNEPALTSLLDCIRQKMPILAGHGQTAGINPARHRQNPLRPFLYCQSSGSTGQAKTIRRSAASWISSFDVNRGLFGLSIQDRVVVLGDLGHSLSLYATVEALHIGADLLVLAGDRPATQLRQMQQHAATVIYATPTQLQLLGRAEGVQAALPSVRLIICGGGVLNDAIRHQAMAICPNARIRVFYGASETSFISVTDDETPEGSVGRPYPGVVVDLRKPDGFHYDIWVKSDYLFDGYEGPGSPQTQWDGPFLTVGEIGCLDASGYLFLRGRRVRMATVAEVNVFLDDVDAIIAQLCTPRLCAVVARPDQQRGNAVCVYIEGPEDAALAGRIRALCRDQLSPQAVPRQINWLAQMPLLPSGKPDLPMLAQMAEGR